MIKVVVGAFVIANMVFAYALCKASGRASRMEEEIYGLR